MDIPGVPAVTEEECAQFRCWFESYSDEIEFAESYSKVLFMRYRYLKANGKIKEMHSCVREMERVARRAGYGEYAEENQLEEILTMIKAGLI